MRGQNPSVSPRVARCISFYAPKRSPWRWGRDARIVPRRIRVPSLRLYCGCPGGPLYVGLCAAGIVGGGLALLIWGWAHDYAQILDRSLMTRRMYGIARATGIIGDTVRGLLIVLIGVYLVASAVTDNPKKVKGLDQALQALAHKPFGVWLLSVAAAGLFSFGLYSAVEARYRRL